MRFTPEAVSVVVILALFRLGFATPSPLILPAVVISSTSPVVVIPLVVFAGVSVSLTVPTTKLPLFLNNTLPPVVLAARMGTEFVPLV